MDDVFTVILHNEKKKIKKIKYYSGTPDPELYIYFPIPFTLLCYRYIYIYL